MREPLANAGPPAPFGRAPSLRFSLLVFAACALTCLFVYRGALHGSFISDDRLFVGNPYVMTPGPDLFAEAFAPGGDVQFYAAGGNYAPVAILVHALEFRLFGKRSFGFHFVNVLVHALNVTLLLAAFCVTGIPRAAAIVAAALFALHPANVEAVAWISQLRTLLAMSFALTALLLFRRHPFLGALPFALGLLSKAFALFALPMAAALCWAWHGRGERMGAHATALGLWALLLATYAPIQFLGFMPPAPESYPDLLTLVRTVCAVGARYVAMAATGFGTAAFQEPAHVQSNLDPWWLFGLALAPLLLWRIATTLRRRSVEAAWWIGAAAAYAPVSQVTPFFYSIADRWLYFVLPGLLGGIILAGRAPWRRLADPIRRSAWGDRIRTLLLGGAAVAAALLLAAFGVHAAARASLWQDDERLNQDAMTRYPQGTLAHRTAAYAALDAGDKQAALRHLRACAERGADIMFPFFADARLVPHLDDPRFQILFRDSARQTILYLRQQGRYDQHLLLNLALSHFYLDEIDRAIETVEEALRHGGPLKSKLSSVLIEFISERTRRSRAADRHPTSRSPDSNEAAARPPTDSAPQQTD